MAKPKAIQWLEEQTGENWPIASQQMSPKCAAASPADAPDLPAPGDTEPARWRQRPRPTVGDGPLSRWSSDPAVCM